MTKKTLWTPKTLYQFWNSRYFGGRLPDIPVYFSKKLGVGRERHTLGTASFYGDGGKKGRPAKICLNPKYKTAFVIWAQTLLHEMVHVQQWRIQKDQAHGRKFQKRIKQLVAVGAYNGLL